MAKLFFRYGTIGSGKTLDLLKVAYNYSENDMNAVLLTSKIDNRYGNDIIKSRAGVVEKEAIGVDEKDDIYEIIEYKRSITQEDINCILVDEVQFFSEKHIYQMSKIVDELNIPVICYGLRSDFKNQPFGASKILMAIADELEEIKTICSVCKKKKASVNAKVIDNVVIFSGETIDIGGNEKYKPMCRKCHNNLKH